MRVELDGDNPHGVTEVETHEYDTPIDAFNLVSALTAPKPLTEEELDHLSEAYSND